MTSIDNDNKFKRKWWLHPMDAENLVELSDSDRRNAKSVNRWLFIWAVLFFGTVNLMEPLAGGLGATPVWRFLIVCSPIVSGLILARAFIRFFGETKDELTRKIHYEALAVGFLFAFFIGMCFELSAVIVGPSAKAGPAIFVGLILGYYISLVLSYRKYNA